jgi:phage tail P2-like protein
MSSETLLPTNIDPILQALEAAGAEWIGEIAKENKKARYFADPIEIDETFLGLLAESFGAERFRKFEPRDRELIDYARRHYPKLGTVAAVKKVMEAFGLEPDVIEWFDSGKDPYLFDVDLSVSDRPISHELLAEVTALIAFAKNARSKLGEVRLAYMVSAECVTACAGVGEASAGTRAVGLVSRSRAAVYQAAACAGEARAYAICKEE